MSQFFDYGKLLKPNKYGIWGLNNFGTKGTLYQNLSDPGGMLFGGSGEYNSLGMKRDGTKGGLFGDKAQGIDYFGSPVTAGTNMQGTARLAALLYGAAAGGSALAGGSAGGGAATTNAAAPTASAGGGLFASNSYAVPASGSAAGGAAGGASTSPGWMKWAKMGQGGLNAMGGQRQSYQPQWTNFDDDDEAQRLLLAQLLRERG